MYHVALPSEISSGENKGQANMVEITSAKLTRKEGDKDVPVKFVIAAELFRYPQFGPQPAKDENGKEVELSEEQAKSGVDEAVKDAGGYVRFLENYNDATRQAALNKGKNYIRTKETGDPSAIQDAGLALTQGFTWAAAERVTNKAVREQVENIVNDLDNLSPDEVKARLRAMLGKK
jgi:hypothetical protein